MNGAKMDFVDRLIQEREELEEKTHKLDRFIQSDKFQTVSREHGELMQRQLLNMLDYYHVLSERIADLMKASTKVAG